MWRKSCHDISGYFDETLVIAGDFDMWVRMIRHGCKFKKIHGIYGMHYANPHGLSTSSKNQTLLKSEIKKVYLKNKDILTSFCIPLEALG
jgi:hypothetical protein